MDTSSSSGVLQDTLPQGKKLRSRSPRMSQFQLTKLDTGADMRSPGDEKKPESDSGLVQNLQRQVAKLHNDLKTSNTQLSLVRQQKTKANDEVWSRRRCLSPPRFYTSQCIAESSIATCSATFS